MKILQRYIGRTVIGYSLLVIFLFLGVDGFLEFLGQLHNIGKHNYGLWQAIVYVLLIMPQDAYQIFPMAGLLGSLIGLGRLASNSELIVMRTAGVSLAQITWAVIKATLIMVVFVTIMGEGIAPKAKHAAVVYQDFAIYGSGPRSNFFGTWVRQGNSFYHIAMLSSHKGTMEGVTRYQFGKHLQLQKVSYAKKGYYHDGHWVFNDVYQSNIAPHKVTSAHFPQQQWDVTFRKGLQGLAKIKPDQKNLYQLYDYIKYRRLAGLDASSYAFAFWQRVFLPFSIIVMICLALPFIFGPLRSSTVGLRMLLGIVLGFTFYLMNRFAGLFGVVYQVPPIVAAALPVVLFTLMGFYLLWRAR